MCQYANAIAFFHWHIIPLGYYLSFTLLHVSFKDTVRLKTNLSTRRIFIYIEIADTLEL